jgi:uncharacterized protein YqeY
MKLIDQIKNQIKTCLKEGDKVQLNILRVVLGDVQKKMADGDEERRLLADTDEEVQRVIRKIMEGNTETLGLITPEDARHAILARENKILQEMLPQTWDAKEIEAFFLNHNDPIFEQIKNAKSEGQATGVAMKALKSVNAPVDGKLVKEVVVRIRSNY